MTPNFENISKEYTLNVFSFTQDFFEFNWHFHPEYEITLILDGQGKRFLGNCAEDFYAQDLVFIGSKIPHTWKSEPQTGTSVSALVIQFSEALLQPIIELSEFSELKKWLDLSAFGLKIKTNDKILKKMQELEKWSGALQIIKFYELLWFLSQQKNEKLLTEAYEIDYSKKHQRITFLLDYLEHHFQNPCTIDEVAALLSLTKSGFAKFFKLQTGVCFSQYMNELRVKKAIKLLTETDQTIKEIYTHVGFENQAYFNRVFRNITSSTPKQYRIAQWGKNS
ncbi:AraC family transcriptional regulator [Cloacibacterium rupense]|uniref:AraC family transcriptional regulator n=1 Tax=Cloacibacterium rupense TaxID=517423 RepID=A0ABQ2NM52_9FLAO|nr:AraC family transcriptional regulator [Cloacibacterium rupense]GGP02591.1 AraC family transcriptional regulator [Cloacibacterium rupense]